MYNLSIEVQSLKLMNALIDRSTVFSDCCRFSGDMSLQVSDRLVTAVGLVVICHMQVQTSQ